MNEDVLCQLDANGLHFTFSFWLEGTDLKIRKNLPSVERIAET
jgi:hypothetical protein